MNLIAILWIACGATALVLAADALLLRFARRTRQPGASTPRIIQFGTLMLVVAIGCVIFGAYEATR